MTPDRLTTTDRIDSGAIAPVVRIGVALVGMVVLLAMSLLLPGTGIEVVEPGITLGDVLLAIGTLGIVAALVYAAPRVRNLLSAWLEGPAEVVASGAAIGAYLVDFVAVLFAYAGFEPVVAPLLGMEWAYDLLFLGIALVFLGAIAYRYYPAMDPLTAFITDKVGSSEPPRRVGEDKRV